MSSVLERAFSILDLLARAPDGLSVGDIAAALGQPPSGTHRMLAELARLGYVRQQRVQGDYQLTIKLASMGLTFLGQTGITDVSQPILDGLAKVSGELVRMAVFDGDNLTWVGVSQGATSALRYDPSREQGVVVHLASSAGGQAWLSAMDDQAVMEAVGRQGLIRDAEPGLSPPRTIAELLAVLGETRERGYSMNRDSYMVGMAAMATVVRAATGDRPIGTVSIAGPSVRMTEARMAELAEPLLQAGRDLSQASGASGYFSEAARATTQSDRQEHPTP
jgi:DNA-binding IclR family transcriptional regulator